MNNNQQSPQEPSSNKPSLQEQWTADQLHAAKQVSSTDTYAWQLHRRVFHNSNDGIRYVAGLDISYPAHPDSPPIACSSAVICELPSLQVVASSSEIRPAPLVPYLPSFLAFRELEPMVDALQELERTSGIRADALLVDGHGRYHPRRCGLACLVGLQLQRACVGVGKEPFLFESERSWHREKIDEMNRRDAARWYEIENGGEVIARAVRCSDSSRQPVFVSVGHAISLETAQWLVELCSRYRVPEPIRHADRISREALRRRRSAAVDSVAKKGKK